MGIKNAIAKAGGKAADKVAKLAVLSPEQLKDMDERRVKYLSQMPSSDDEAAAELTSRLMAASSVEIYNAYLPQIQELYAPIQSDIEYGESFKDAHNIRYINITKWVTDANENNLEKLVNVYEVLSNEDCNIALVFHRTCEDTEVFLGITNTHNDDNNVSIDSYADRILDAIRGNFPGAEWKNEDGIGIIPCLKNNAKYSIAAASNIPTEKSEKFISQTIEKLLDGIIPDKRTKEYTIILLATPVQDVEERKLKLAEFYSGFAPYAQWQTNFTYTESDATNSTATFGVNAGVSAGVQHGQNTATTNTSGTTDSTGSSVSDTTGSSTTDSTGLSTTDTTGNTVTDTTGSSVGDTTSSSSTHTDGVNNSVTDTSGKNSGNSISLSATENASVKVFGTGVEGSVSEGYSHNWGKFDSTGTTAGTSASDALTEGLSKTITDSTSKSVAENISQAVTSSTGRAIASSVGKTVANTLGKAVTSSVANTVGAYKGVNFGGNFGANFARSSNVTATVGKNEGITQSFTNYTIKHTLEILEAQMQRLEQSTALGMWDFAAYVLSEDHNVANNVAHSYLALTQGDESFVSQSAVNLWRGDRGDNSKSAEEICTYLRELRHPLFGLKPALTEADPQLNVYPAVVTATTSLSGKELAYSLNFPQKSVSGLPVIECAEFGRNVVTYEAIKEGEASLRLGSIFHMNHVERSKVELSKKSLASHVFVTGSTGSGKSNTVYKLLDEALKEDVKFLVVEPAKGEYKEVFGNDSDVSVYGTNPVVSPLLRINPFSFPDKIHVLEHMDRLIEIFNVCWPMYAAMPAVLKNAVEKSYEDCGWDLVKSTNKYGERLYPTFADVAKNIKVIIDTSDYDSDNKGAYKGSLLTRLQSLATGINGLIFASDEIASDELFDRNVIVDLSRVGSSETKSLIMGMLVLKLQEYRMSSRQGINAELKHITVLEEAHNILRRTSTEQSTESANLLGKSVEMISNAIAEMRTYGEGFVIADQAPGLMDMSVIRNTNTKIILRLPDQSDRELVGRAANLNEDQITELAKLPCGVAAIYQNEWIQPVLCKVDKYETPTEAYEFTPNQNEMYDRNTDLATESLLDCIMDKEIFKKGDRAEIQKLKSLVIKSGLDSAVKVDFLEYIAAEKEKTIESLRPLIYDFLSAEEAIRSSKQCDNINEWIHMVVDGLKPSVKEYTKKQIDLAMALVLYEQTLRDATYGNVFCLFTEVYKNEGGVF